MRRAVGTWLAVIALVVGVGAAGVLALHATTFGPAAFVRVYLEAVARGDAAGALALPGVTVPEGARDDFLVRDALPGLAALREVSTEAGPHGTTVVTYAWRSARGDGVSSFVVERAGVRFGLFPAWAFAESPVATLRLTVEHDQRFELDGVAAVTGVAAAQPVEYALLAPGVYRADHRSTFLEARHVDIPVETPGAAVSARLDVQPSTGFVEAVEAEVRAHLDACASQEVLFPTGCPFGRDIPNRVLTPPEWSIVEHPVVRLTPSAEFGRWLVPSTELVAHVRVEVQSLFDGGVSTLDEDVAATASYLVTILADDTTLRIDPVD